MFIEKSFNMNIGIYIFWGIISLICALLGSERRVGALGGFFLGFFLSLIGFVIVICSKPVKEEKEEELNKVESSSNEKMLYKADKVAEELQMLGSLHAQQIITKEEFEKLKARVIG